MSQIIGGHTFVPLEKGIDDVKLNAITGGATITSELISTQTQTTSTGTGDYFLLMQAAGNLAKILTTDLATSIGSSSGMVNAITSVRLRSFNSVGNPGFEVDQKLCGASATVPAAGGSSIDRWISYCNTASTMRYSAQQLVQSGSLITVPGTNYVISRNYYRITLTAAQASLAAGEYFYIYQQVEGSNLRELINDTTSLQLLVRSSVAGLKFAAALQDPSGSRSYVHLCTIPSANSWTLISIPAIPVMPSAGTFSVSPGTAGYLLSIGLAGGTTYTASANDTWLSANAFVASGQSNFAASPVNSTFDIAFCQHEPGSACTTLQDKPFSVAYDECLRYFQKTYSYPTAPGTITNNGTRSFVAFTSTAAFGPASFLKPMAKVPSAITFYNLSTGASGSVQDQNGTNHASAVAQYASDSGFLYLGFATATSNNCAVYAHYTVDTGW